MLALISWPILPRVFKIDAPKGSAVAAPSYRMSRWGMGMEEDGCGSPAGHPPKTVTASLCVKPNDTVA